MRQGTYQFFGERAKGLTIYAAQLGWLHATPKGNAKNRMAGYLDRAMPLPLPDLDPDEYMLELMMELGPVRSTGEGLTATDWPVVAAFAGVKGLDHHDTSTLAAMCRAYCDELQAAESPLRIPPIDRGTEN